MIIIIEEKTEIKTRIKIKNKIKTKTKTITKTTITNDEIKNDINDDYIIIDESEENTSEDNSEINTSEENSEINTSEENLEINTSEENLEINTSEENSEINISEENLEDTKISKPGYIYVVYNDLYSKDDQNILKIGRTINIEKRLHNFQTYYYKETKLLYLSDLCIDHIKAEYIIHKKLLDYRLDIGEFFNVELDIAINIIKEVVNNINNNIQDYYCYRISSYNEKKNIIEDNKQNIINARDINKFDNLTLDDRFAIEKYLYKQTFKIDIIDEDIMNKIFRKSHIVHNLNYLIDNIPININNITIDDNYIKYIYDETNNLTLLEKQKNICLELLSTLGFSLDKIKEKNVFSKTNVDNLINNKILVTKESFKNKIKVLVDKDHNEYFFTEENIILFKLQLKKYEFKTTKSFLGLINTILKIFGISIFNKKYSVKKDKENFYMLCVDPLFI